MPLTRITTKEGEVYFVDSKTGERVEVDARYTNTKPNPTKLRFSSLVSLGQFVFYVGWIIFSLSIVGIIIGIVEIKTMGAILIIGGAVCLINGLLVTAIGHSISCLVSIKHNTYETNQWLESLQGNEKNED